jgi:oligoribonuclease NrnB/cAMP/cGMP phosphodiesterase (DHH superfamily)
MKIFYHDDADGKCAARVVTNKFIHTLKRNKKDYIEVNYGGEFPFDVIKKDETVYILDYSIELADMDLLREITTDIHWIDHHITAIKKYENYPHKIQGKRNTRYSGCVLTYMYLNNASYEDAPLPIQYIGDRDTWQWEYGEKTEYFFSGSELYDLHPLSDDWYTLFNNPDKVIKEGKIVEKYKIQRNKEYVDSYAYSTVFEGHEARVVNIGKVDSKIFDSLEKKPLLIMYVHDGKQYKISLRSESLDVSKITLKYGGGGHPGSSGFESQKIPWE